MAQPNFPTKIWDGLSEDRRNHEFKRTPSTADWEQAVAEIQALQIQVSSLLQQLKVTPVLSMSDIIAEVVASTDKRYVTPAEIPTVIKDPLPRIPNTFIWINDKSQGTSLTADQMMAFIYSNADKRYMPINYTPPHTMTFQEMVAQLDARYLPSTTVSPQPLTIDQITLTLDQRYKPISYVAPSSLSIQDILAQTDQKYLTKVQADGLYLPKNTVLFTKAQADTFYAPISALQSMPTFTAGDARWKLKSEK